MTTKLMWRGKPLESLSREELENAVVYLAHAVRQRDEEAAGARLAAKLKKFCEQYPPPSLHR